MTKLVTAFLLFLKQIVLVQSISLPVSEMDLFVLKNGKLMQENHAEALNKTWYSLTSDYKLDVLKNDRIMGASLDSCVEHSSETSTGSKIIEFKDIAEKAGLVHEHRDHIAARPHCTFDFVIPFHNSSRRARLAGEFCSIDHITGGAAAGDYDGDGLQDLFFTVFYKRSVLYKNLGNGKFLDVTAETGVGPEKYGNGALWVDIDQDGDLDLYVTTVGDSRHYLYVNYDGIFQEEAIERGISLQFPNKRKLSGFTPNVGDFDNDGYPDIYASEWILHSLDAVPSASKLMRNLGKAKPGYFEDVTDKAGVNMDKFWSSRTKFNAGTHTFGSSFTDFDNDGQQELLITGDYGESKMFWNNGNMTFSECTKPCGLIGDIDAMGHAIGDLNNDGYLEWFSSAIFDNSTNCEVSGCMFGNKGNKLYQNLGNRRFTEISTKVGVSNGGWGWGSAFFDFNNDGFLDIVLTNGFDTPSTTIDDNFMKQQMMLYQNYGNEMAGQMKGKMKEVSSEHGMNHKGMGRGLLKFDYDNDGDEDVIVATNFGRAVFYENVGGNKKNWLRIRVVHRCFQNLIKLCDSYGARVTVTDPSGRNQTQEIGSSTHFLGQSEILAHFGLEDFTHNITVRVTWPATNYSVIIKNVRSRNTLRITKPSSMNHKVSHFADFKRCEKLNITRVTVEPGSLFGVEISKDQQSLILKPHPAIPLTGIGKQAFYYTVQVGSRSSNQHRSRVTIDARLYIRNKTLTSMCPYGRMWLPGMPIPTKTAKRTYNGISNNMNNLYWGAALENLRRLVPHRYQDDISMPAGTCSKQQRDAKTCPFPHENSGYGSNRPSSRFISNELFAQKASVISERGLSDLHVHYGQFFVHDLDFSSPLPRFEFQGNLNEVWMQISVPKNDSHFDQDGTGKSYLPFTRSTYNRCTGMYPNGYPREQVNKISSYIDATDTYGSSESRCKKLRTMKDGKMKLEDDGLIPKNVMGLDNDNVIGRKPPILRVAGDTRANVAPGLLAFHTLFVLEHNRLCDVYKSKHPAATDEEIFQYARRIVIAEHQAIAFREYLPATLGASSIPPYKGYNASIDVGVSNVFATAAFRFGHSQVNTHIFRLDEKWNLYKHGHILLRESYFHPERVANEGGIEPVLRGMIYMPAQKIDTLLVDELRNALFPVGRGNGLDLASMNIQRGRDHGLPDFNNVRRLLGLKAFKSFSEITKNASLAKKLEEIYKSIDNIDLWVGGLAEDHMPGSELGETFHTIFLEGVLRIRDGDRLWYEKIMSKEEIDMVNGLTLSKIIQLNTGIKDIPYNVFFSTKICKDVVKHQCVERESSDPSVLKTQLQQEKNRKAALQAKVDAMSKSTDELRSETATLEAVCIVLGVIIFLFLVALGVMFLRKKPNKHAGKNHDHVNGFASTDCHVLENHYAGNGNRHVGNGNGHVGYMMNGKASSKHANGLDVKKHDISM